MYSKHSTDIELIQGCKQKDKLAQKYLYQRFYGRMMVICLRYTSNQDEAQDVLNRSFLKVFSKIEDYKHLGALSGWIAKIVFHSSIDYVRSNTRYKKIMDFEKEAEAEIPSSILDQLVAEDLYKSIQLLPSEMRSVFSLYVLDGYKHREIAEMLDISINTSKWHLASAKKELRNLLKNYDKSRLAV